MTNQTQLNWQRTNLDNIENAWDGDLWDRKRLGIQLTNYVDRLNCGAVLALDARWGEGKTWFVRHWKKHLETENHNVIYLDAFANDYLEDPFLVISSEITACLSKDDDIDASHISAFKEKAAAAYHALLPSLPKVLLTLGLNLISGGILGVVAQDIHKAGEKVIESVTDVMGDKIKESIEEKIESHEADKNTLLAFKQELAQLAQELDQPLVFIIDELDRCRPDFAIRLIERIKHFFDIPKIVFILVMDKIQLSNIICHSYGYRGFQGEEYLDKFIDFTVHLSNMGVEKEFENIVREQLFKIGELSDIEEINAFYFLALSIQLLNKCNAREFTKKINQYALLRTRNLQNNFFLYLCIFILKKETTIDDIISFLELISSKLMRYLYLDKYEIIKKFNLSDFNMGRDLKKETDSFFINFALREDYDISYFVHEFLFLYRNIKTQSNNLRFQEQELLEFFKKYSVCNIDNSKEFIHAWHEYIQTGL
ncbi:KAP family P-loop NTPase fold protein [Acinetobacter sp. ANC 3832]|uniref:KAP family P-loop NTPase fold protein n=1 Tax=Acinetobacter sp. ANC 3832 TaxID=1977874 RepID=UPI000A33F17B|nr:P-loop NTPase fold protein [Acinetobacter sp. ANC 3832]OTG92537.1 hypothetical protein B9T35_12685 [Acinetobacter sp. ANC 3832]